MSYIHLKIGNRCFSIHQAWVELLVYGTSYYLVYSFLLKFLINYSISHDNLKNHNSHDNSNNIAKDSKTKNNIKNKLNIIRGGDNSINNELLAAILEQCFDKDGSYTIVHPDFINKIREFIKATASQGIKVVPLSVAVLAVIHQNRHFSVVSIGAARLLVDNVDEFKIKFIKNVIKGAGMGVAGVLLTVTPAGRFILSFVGKQAVKPLIKLLPAGNAILKRELIQLAIGGSLLLAPVSKEVGTALATLPAIQTKMSCLRVNCDDYVEKLASDAKQEKIKYVQYYQKPDTRVIIQGSSEHIICIPEKPVIIDKITKIPTLGGDVIVGEKSIVKKKVIAHEKCKVNYRVHKDKIPEPRDFSKSVTVETVEKAEKMMEDAKLLNDDDFNMSPKAKAEVIKVRNN